MSKLFILLSAVLATGATAADLVADPPNNCEFCADWNQPRKPFRIFANTWFVGTQGLSSILITSDQGHILIDGGLPQSAPLIADNIRKLGFRLEDVKLLLNSHTHYDHAGGLAALQRASGGEVAASPASRQALERGGPTEDDPQFAFGHEHNDYAPLPKVRAIADGETLRVGDLAITAHFTPGHTPGGTSWTWRSCVRDNQCESMAYVDSLNSISAPGFKFSADPQRVAAFEASIATVEKLPCDIMFAPHPAQFDLDKMIEEGKRTPSLNAFVNTLACQHYAAGARERLVNRLAEERATP